MSTNLNPGAMAAKQVRPGLRSLWISAAALGCAFLVQTVQLEVREILWMLMLRPERNQVTRAPRHRVLMAPEITRTDSVKVTLAGEPLNQE